MPFPTVIDMIRDLIAMPSVSSVNPELDMGNRAVIDRLATWLEQTGFAVEILPVGDGAHKANLVATLGSGEGGLVLSGHTDTVPCDEGRWQSDPFTLHESDNRLYGLGTADMKSFLAIAIEAIRQMDSAKLRRPLTLLATADEESTMLGAKQLAASGRRFGDFVIIGEPTGLKPVNRHKGVMMEAITLTGRCGHSSDPALGVSALEGMHAVMDDLLIWRDTLQAEHHDAAFEVPVPTLNLGSIHGGDNPNRICGECELQLDLRPLPGMAIPELRNTLRQRVRAIARDRGLEVGFSALFDGIPAMATAAESPIVQAAVALTGSEALAVSFATEGSFYNSLAMETVILGPGNIEQAHQANEYLETAAIQPMVVLLRNLIARFCQ